MTDSAKPVTTHVYPVDDLGEHNTDGQPCPCQPTTKEIWNEHPRVRFCGRIVTHNAWDKRELREHDHRASAS